MFQARVKILYNKKIQGNYFHLVLQAPKITRESLPGQFLNIKVNDADEPLLRRPLSIHGLKGTNIGLLYEVVGRATEVLSHRKSGEYLDIIGPLGNGFNYQLPITNYQLPILVAGGMGVAPLVFLAEKLMERTPNAEYRTPLVLIGAKTKNQILCEKEFKQFGCEVKIATDDGSKGFKGRVTELLGKILVARRTSHVARQSLKRPGRCYVIPETIIYACGPQPMLKEISRISKKYSIPAQLSLEEHMACGIGACLGCVANTKEGFKRVCKEGTVFKADEIVW